MAKKERKKSFFKRSVKVANDNFRNIFKDIVKNAKENSDVDLKILEPDIKSAIKEVANELKKDKNDAKFKMEELKGIVTNAFSSVKEAVRTDEKNGLDESTKKDWYNEIDDFDIGDFIDNIDFDEEELDDDEEASFENEDQLDCDHMKDLLTEEQIQRAFDGVVLILTSIKDKNFKDFFTSNKDNISSILSYKTCNCKEMPIEVEPKDEKEVDLGVTRSLELVYQYFSTEDDIVDEEANKEDPVTEYLDTLEEPEYEKVDNGDNKLLTDEVLKEYKEVITMGEEYRNRFMTIRERMNDTEKHMIDYAISCLLEIYDMYLKSQEYKSCEDSECSYHCEFPEYFMNNCEVLDMTFIREKIDGSNIFKLELILVILLNIPAL